MSVTGNELALRFGRQRIIYFFMCASGVVACGLGFTVGLPSAVVFAVMCLHYGLMLGDSAALTAGTIGSAHADQRGAMMAVYSFTGFSAAFMAPLVFGVVLDVAGGNRSTLAWGLAYASLGVFGALAPLLCKLKKNQ
jgi:MFS family permease